MKITCEEAKKILSLSSIWHWLTEQQKQELIEYYRHSINSCDENQHKERRDKWKYHFNRR